LGGAAAGEEIRWQARVSSSRWFCHREGINLSVPGLSMWWWDAFSILCKAPNGWNLGFESSSSYADQIWVLFDWFAMFNEYYSSLTWNILANVYNKIPIASTVFVCHLLIFHLYDLQDPIRHS
jgi:hypothetical protein